VKLTPENKAHIDALSYQGLLSHWRFAPSGDPWLQGETGDYWSKRMRASERGWSRPCWGLEKDRVGTMTVRRHKDPQLIYSLEDIDQVVEFYDGLELQSPLSRSERLDVFKRFEAMMGDQWFGLMEQALVQVIANRKEHGHGK